MQYGDAVYTVDKTMRSAYHSQNGLGLTYQAEITTPNKPQARASLIVDMRVGVSSG